MRFTDKFMQSNIPFLCTPIIGKTKEELIDEIASVSLKNPDIIEWRVDYFQDIHDFEKVVEVARTLKEVSNDIPLLLTLRSVAEGGNPTSLSTMKVVELLVHICKTSFIDLIDFEINNPDEEIRQIKKAAIEHDKFLILSYHDYSKTPANEELIEIFKRAQTLGADVAKIAVMPNDHGDVLRLLDVTNQAKEVLQIPVATMSLNSLGAISRMFGWVFGSRLIYTVGANSSAPGQIPIEEIQRLIKTISTYQK
ncbi:type I 3-dehydroquinate dehydratase [Robertmurraya kyonggiensis]|uniref:3-dehydroquinate dehydratase n=2 Tax=Robertmurraya kyonggiensis TaxID=1037680 RepID=A0A4U1DAE2_9BACI|nr:type I 3-dehydroquinate dehydratase [Robertmurraya kyonggiensis]